MHALSGSTYLPNTIHHQAYDVNAEKKSHWGETLVSIGVSIAIAKAALIGSFVLTTVFCCTFLPVEAIFAIPVVISVISAVASFFIMRKILISISNKKHIQPRLQQDNSSPRNQIQQIRTNVATPSLTLKQRIENKTDEYKVGLESTFRNLEVQSQEVQSNLRINILEAHDNDEISEEMIDVLDRMRIPFDRAIAEKRNHFSKMIRDLLNGVKRGAIDLRTAPDCYSSFHELHVNQIQRLVNRINELEQSTINDLENAKSEISSNDIDHEGFVNLRDSLINAFGEENSKMFAEVKSCANGLVDLSNDIKNLL